MGLTSVGPDGIAVSGYGWTNQASATFNTNKSLESYGPASSASFNAALRRGYQAQTFEPYLASGTAVSIATTIAQLIYVPTTFTCATVDVIVVANTGNTTIALWPANAPAGVATPLAWSAATAAVASSTVNAFTFGGASSPASVTLVGGNYYFVTAFGAATAPTLAASPTAGSANIVNAAASGTYSAATTYFVGSVGTVTTVSAASVFGTSTLNVVSGIWVGLH